MTTFMDDAEVVDHANDAGHGLEQRNVLRVVDLVEGGFKVVSDVHPDEVQVA